MSTVAVQKKVLRVLHVGVDNRGRWPLEKCRPELGFQSAALCDVSPQALARARQITGLSEKVCFTDFDQALEHAEADCVIICAPTAFHVPMTKKAVQRGLPVLVEKGMAPDWTSALDLVRTVLQHNAIVAVAQNYRYNPVERTIHRALHDPDFPAYLGRVHIVCYTQNRVRPHPGNMTYPFASVWDMSCHHFDNLLFWLGPIRQMTAFSWKAHWSAYPYDNNTTAHIVMENETRVHYIHMHDAARNVFEIELHGERGALVVRDGQVTFNQRPLEQFGSRPLMNVPLVEAHGEEDMLRDFYDYVVHGVEPGISARRNLETMAACEMMVRSIREARTVRRDELERL